MYIYTPKYLYVLSFYEHLNFVKSLLQSISLVVIDKLIVLFFFIFLMFVKNAPEL